MTQEIIEKHLLNVGSSRYQDSAFKEEFPDFNSISRFGIGVLSSFMVADTIQIVTFADAEADGRQISLRSVHGKYLIRLLNKYSPEYNEIGPHGTKITLTIRSSSKKVDVKGTLDRWIVFPRCEVLYSENGKDTVTVGFKSAKAALADFIKKIPELEAQESNFSVIERKTNDLEIAVVLRYSKHFRENSFYSFSTESASKNKIVPAVGLCVEGIRVDFNAGGLERSNLLSIANCVGPDAPKTNVSRSALESDTAKSRVNEEIFQMYLDIAKHEIARLQLEEKFSLSYATNQFPFIAGPIYQRNAGFIGKGFDDFPLLIIEDASGRKAGSLSELETLGSFWTVESKAIDSLMELLQDVKSDATALEVSARCGFKGEPMPNGPMVTNIQRNWLAKTMVERGFEICEIKGSILDRRLDVRWRRKPSEATWNSLPSYSGREFGQVSEDLRGRRRFRSQYETVPSSLISVPSGHDVVCNGLEDFIAVSVLGTTHLIPGTDVSKFFDNLPRITENDNIVILLYLEALAPAFVARTSGGRDVYAEIEFHLREVQARYGERFAMDTAAFLGSLQPSKDRLSTFEPYSWSRGTSWDQEFTF